MPTRIYPAGQRRRLAVSYAAGLTSARPRLELGRLGARLGPAPVQRELPLIPPQLRPPPPR